jgi:hypothetical protein
MNCRVISRIFVVFVVAFLAGCGGGGTPPPQEVSVNVTPGTAQVQTGQTKQFTATVLGSSNTAVTWSVVGGDANGTISTAGLYTAPATVPSPATVTVKAVSQADTTRSGTATVTVTGPPAVSVTVSPKTATVLLGGSKQFTAVVANSDSSDVTWTLSSTSCTGAACGTIDSTGLYTAPASLPVANVRTANVASTSIDITVTAASVADPTKTDTAMITLTDQLPTDNNAAMSGNYVFYYSGYTSAGAEVARGGTLVFDGQGNISGGMQDIVAGGTLTSYTLPSPTQSTYTLDANNHGVMKVMTSGTLVEYRFILSSDGSARIMQFEANGVHGSGQMTKQSGDALGALSGPYVMAVTGSATSMEMPRASAAYRINVSGSNVTAELGELAVTGYPYASGAATSGEISDSNRSADLGRTVVQLTSAGNLGTFKLPVYMYSAGEGFVIGSNDTFPVALAGSITKQVGAGSFSTGSLNARIVFQAAGYDADPGDRTHTLNGTLTPSTAKPGTFSGMLDTNDYYGNSSVSAPISMIGTYTVDQATGIGTLTLTDPVSGDSAAMVLLFTGQNKGYVIEGMPNQTAKDALIGTFEPASGTEGLSGTYRVSTTLPTMPEVPMFLGTVDACNGTFCNGTDTAYSDANGTLVDGTGDVSGTYTLTSTGRGTGTLTVGSLTYTVALYPVSASKVYAVCIDQDQTAAMVMVLEKM